MCARRVLILFFCFKQKTAYEMRISDWSSDVCSSDLLYRQQLFGGSQPEPRVGVQVVTELAWPSQFIRTLLCRPTAAELAAFDSQYTIIALPSFRAAPAKHGTPRVTVVPVTFTEKVMLIAGPYYARPMTKSALGIHTTSIP